MWGLGAAAFFHLGRRLGLGVGRAFIVALIPWVWPINYGFVDKASIPVMAVDAAFIGALHVTLAMSIVFALDPRRTLSAILAGLSIGVAIWGRGNSGSRRRPRRVLPLHYGLCIGDTAEEIDEFGSISRSSL